MHEAMWLALLMSAVALASGGPALEKGVIYVQKSYHYTNTLDMNIEVFQRDAAVIAAAGFKNIGLRVSFGELVSTWDAVTKTATYNESKCNALGTIAQTATAHGLRLIFNTHLLDTVPQGIDGSYFVPGGGPDIYGVPGGDGHNVWRSHFIDVMARDEYREPMLLFHSKFASCFADSPTAPHYWKHAFESCYVFPSNVPDTPAGAATVSAAAIKFGQWARDANASLQHWRDRWGEPNLASFGSITLPSKSKGNKAKNGDFWRFWLIGILKTGRYGMSISDIHAALQKGAGAAFKPLLAFKHWRPDNFLRTSDLTHAELVDAFDLPINATALGYYVNDAATFAGEPSGFAAYIDSVRTVAPRDLPVIVWETGGSTYNLTLSQQADWAKMMMATAASKGIGGFNWWQFIDWAPYPATPCDPTTKQGLTKCQLFHFGAHFLNGSTKPVWDVLVS